MGHPHVHSADDERELRSFTQSILRDVTAFERLLQEGRFETGERRMGLEQELFLVDETSRVAPVGPEILASNTDPRITSELARFNLEVNLEPRPLASGFLTGVETELREVLEEIARIADLHGARPLLTGILPTLRRKDLGLGNMSPHPRYERLNDTLKRLRGGDFSVFIRGLEQLTMECESVMHEAANASLQLHLQVDPDDFASAYNMAQLITAPLLAAATGSPLLHGRRLWHETRVALFELSVDSRTVAEHHRGHHSRVTFGSQWIRESPLEIFRRDASRFRVIMTCDVDEDPLERIDQGEAPRLRALCLHNGTIWRWNRPCYGVLHGKPHLRIENRVLPSGPSVLDEVANTALFYGLMARMPDLVGDVAERLSFEEAKTNFLAAARHGLDAHFHWIDGRSVAARELLLEDLLPAAAEGLASLGVESEESDRYLGVIAGRVKNGITCARWMLGSFDDLLKRLGNREAAARELTDSMLEHQQSEVPVHEWPRPMTHPPRPERARHAMLREVMTSELFTVRPTDVVDLATKVMEWHHIRHIPVEEEGGKLVGLISHSALLQLWERTALRGAKEPVAVEDIMDDNPPTAPPDMTLHEAMRHILESKHGCLLVVSQGHLVGIVTERDVLREVYRSTLR